MEQVEPTAELPAVQPMPAAVASADASPAEASLAPSPPAPIEAPAVVPLAEPVEAPPAAPASQQSVVYLVAPTPSRRLAESLILFVSAIFFLRSLAVEPFGVPTGSMAPTLAGNHKIATCPRCGFATFIGDHHAYLGVAEDGLVAEGSPAQRAGLRPGDLVTKFDGKNVNSFDDLQALLRKKNASDEVHVLVKRSGELLSFTVKLGAQYPKVATCANCGKADIDISNSVEVAGDRLLVDKNIFALRKPRRWEPAVFRCPDDLTKPYVKRVIGLPGEKIQLLDGDVFSNGRLARKSLTEALETCVLVFDMNYSPHGQGWASRWSVEQGPTTEPNQAKAEPSTSVQGAELHIDAEHATERPVWAAYKHQRYDDASGSDHDEVLSDSFLYNGAMGESGVSPVHDFIVEFELEVVGGAGLIFCRLGDGVDRVVASVPVGAGSQHDAQLTKEGFGVVRAAPAKPLREKQTYRVQMAFVDRRASFAIDGSQTFPAFDLEPLEKRPEVKSPLAIGVQGARVVVRDLKLYRDIYYRSNGGQPLQLGADEYFMLGDNSANSFDSRSWTIPGVPERNFLGKPFLLHQPSRIAHWTFNGRQRTFPSIDWSRVRFLR